jgi:hypothetical protein
MKNNMQWILILLCLQAVDSVAAEKVQLQPGVVLRDSSVYQSPNRRSALLYKIEEDTKVFIKQRQKSWYEIDAESQDAGWLRLLAVRYLGDPKQGVLGEVADFSSKVFNVQRTGPVVTTGARGIDEEEFNEADPDFVTLDIILAKKINKAEVLSFANKERITTKDVKIPSATSAQKEKGND